MRSIWICSVLVMTAIAPAASAGASVVNGSFEEGTNNGWIIWPQPWGANFAEYHDPPVQQCTCGHGLTAADGQYFGGYTYNKGAVGHDVFGHVLYRQAIDVSNWSANADRTRFDFEIWAQVAHSGDWNAYEQQQEHIIWWAEDGLMPHDTAIVYMSGPSEDEDNIADGDTIEIDTGGVNRVYEFDVGDGIRPTSDVAVHVGSSPVVALLKYPRNMRDGDRFTLDVGGASERIYEFDVGDGIQPDSDVAIDCSAGLGRANAKVKTLEAIANDPQAPWVAADYANDKISLTWSNGYNAVNSRTFVDAGNSWITDFIYVNQRALAAKAALITTINNDPLAPCTASETSMLKATLLTWKQTSSGGATNSNLNDAYGHIEVSNFGHLVGSPQHTTNIGDSYQAPETPRSFTLGRVKSQFFSAATVQNFNNWRHLKISGSIPDNPQVVILEIRLKIDGRADLSHNVFDGVVFSAESASGGGIGPFASDVPNGDFEVGPFNLIHNGTTAPDPPTDWELLRGFNGDEGPIEGYTNGVTTPTDPLGTATPSGDHFWGRASPGGASGSQLSGQWGHVIPVRNWSPRATGVRYKFRYLTQMSNLWDTNPLPTPSYPDQYRFARETFDLCWDQETSGYSVLDSPLDPISADMLWNYSNWFSWMRILEITDSDISDLSDASPTGFVELERSGEFSATKADGTAGAPRYLLLRNDTRAYAGLAAVQPYKLMYDDIDFVAEAFPAPCNSPRADLDGDGDVDQEDFGLVQACLTAEAGGISSPPDGPDCYCADFDADGLDVDLADLTLFETCASGPDIPADPGCLVEACCLPEGCEDLHPVECTTLGGTPQGVGTSCAANPCP
ncbi:MAG: hypothetical protein AMXMBFR13_01660 [Phycisphaerae bacterium]